MKTATFALLALTLAAPSCLAGGRITVRIEDGSGNVTPARAWVDAGGERLFQPAAPETTTPYARDRSFSCDGTFTMDVPAGKAVIHVEKGKEFLPIDVEVEVSEGSAVEQTIHLERWVDMPDAGWYSADLHVHLGYDDLRVLKQLALADDVHLTPSFTYWLRGTEDAWHAEWPSDEFRRPISIDSRHVVTRNNIEIERIHFNAEPGASVGATFLYNLNRPVSVARFGEYFPTDADLCRIARMDSPDSVFDCDKPSWAETVIGAALGQLDTVQVCHNHYHRLATITGGFGMIGPLAAGESNSHLGDGLFHRTNSLYYRLLNCGFRLGVSGGSAIGVMPVPTGYNRVYAKIEGPLTPEKFWDAVKNGRTFATSGPMLTLTANGEDVGSTLAIDSSTKQLVSVAATVRSIESLEALQIIHDGTVVETRDLRQESGDPVIADEMEFQVTPRRSGWIAARVLYRAPDGLLRQAHTSPIYLSVDGKPTASARDARYMLRWIERLAEIAMSGGDRFPDTDTRDAVLATYAEASARYGQIIDSATEHWGD
ncbi:MAG: CehA/McbA family metallohydrolase [Planctomycetaceae bacterium]